MNIPSITTLQTAAATPLPPAPPKSASDSDGDTDASGAASPPAANSNRALDIIA